jgi:hypothetical protein
MNAHVRLAMRSAAPQSAILVVLLVATLAARPAAAANCTASQACLDGANVFSSSAAVFDSSIVATAPLGARTAYDLPQGQVLVYKCCGLGTVFAAARDAFDLVGVPPGTPVTVTAEFQVEGEIISEGCGTSGCCGNLEGRITDGAVTRSVLMTEYVYAVANVPVSGLVQLPVAITAGQPEVLEFRLSAWRCPGGNHGADGVGRIRFSGLPAGASIVSCNGYSLTPVPALRRSWGQLKTLYR